MRSREGRGQNLRHRIQGGQKSEATTFESSHLLLTSLTFLLHDFWQTSTPFYSAQICWFHIHQSYHTKWRHLAKVNNFEFAFNECKGNFSKGCSAEPAWTNCSIISKDGKIETNGSVVLKIWVVKHSGLTFWPPCRLTDLQRMLWVWS